MATFTAAINALVVERDRHFIMRVATDYNLSFEELYQKYLETGDTAIKVPRKYTKKPKAVAVATEEGAESAPKPAKEPKAKAEKAKCTACTSKKEPCKFSALKGEVFCKRHLRASQEGEGAEPKPKAAKKAAVPKGTAQPVHTHELTQQPTEPCQLCESHGDPLDEQEADFEVVVNEPTLTVAERLAAILAESDAESDSDSEPDETELLEEAFEDD